MAVSICSGACDEERRWPTRPCVFSTRMAFFLGSVTSWPAMVGRMSLGGTCRRPGPRRRAFLECDGISEGSIWSPGSTKTGSEAMVEAVCSAASPQPCGLFCRSSQLEQFNGGAARSSAARVRTGHRVEGPPKSALLLEIFWRADIADPHQPSAIFEPQPLVPCRPLLCSLSPVDVAQSVPPRIARIKAHSMAENNSAPAASDRVAIGITFGNSNGSIAFTTDDKADVIANEDGGMCIGGSLLCCTILTPLNTRPSDPYRPVLR